VWLKKWVVEKPVSTMDGLLVECVGNRHDNIKNILRSTVIIVAFFGDKALIPSQSFITGDLIWWMSPILNQLNDMELIVFSMQDNADVHCRHTY
jgi:hypothetical protein